MSDETPVRGNDRQGPVDNAHMGVQRAVQDIQRLRRIAGPHRRQYGRGQAIQIDLAQICHLAFELA